MAGDRYQTFRSVSDTQIFALCREGTFYESVPADVRRQGPWQGRREGPCSSRRREKGAPVRGRTDTLHAIPGEVGASSAREAEAHPIWGLCRAWRSDNAQQTILI